MESNEDTHFQQTRNQGRTYFLTINCEDGEEEFKKSELHCVYAVG